ncbi:hypothetical protein UG55_100781 [Frankia sp. EI5c]|uniref:hypothetical protein n=1 Tax=Frankia sp. EI5c TaxID=683316 RepID=UPI0007C2E967|nr:hypothetical protein [Frankia sp. EI5c]OAA27753.1 hypothetical protein UG55_100781 [Frankia sp. EI5c]
MFLAGLRELTLNRVGLQDDRLGASDPETIATRTPLIIILRIHDRDAEAEKQQRLLPLTDQTADFP